MELFVWLRNLIFSGLWGLEEQGKGMTTLCRNPLFGEFQLHFLLSITDPSSLAEEPPI